MQKNRLIKLTIILLLFLPNVMLAESVTLKSGKKIEGKILEKTDKYIRIEFNGNPIYYELKYIESIDEDKAPVVLAQEGFSSQDANFYLKAGLEYGSEAQFKEAEEEFKKGLEINTSDHNLQEALKMTDDLKNGIIKEDYALYLFKGTYYLMDAQYKEAITEFKEALKLKPNDPDLYYYLGICHYSLEEYNEAITHLEKAKEIRPDDPELYYYLGISHYSLGQYPQAIISLEKVLEIDPDDAEAQSIVGASNYSLGNLKEAKDSLYKAEELFKRKGDSLKAAEIEDFLSKLD